MSTYVLIPGMNHGGWRFDDLAGRLRVEGHTVLVRGRRRVRDDPAWEVHVLDSKHNFMRDVPEKPAAILLDVAF